MEDNDTRNEYYSAIQAAGTVNKTDIGVLKQIASEKPFLSMLNMLLYESDNTARRIVVTELTGDGVLTATKLQGYTQGLQRAVDAIVDLIIEGEEQNG